MPESVTPTRYALTLEIVPRRDHFRGTADIRVRFDTARSALWLHDRGQTIVHVHDRVVLDVRVVADLDALGVTTRDRVEPDGRTRAELHLAHHDRAGRDEGGRMNVERVREVAVTIAHRLIAPSPTNGFQSRS